MSVYWYTNQEGSMGEANNLELFCSCALGPRRKEQVYL